MTGNKETCDFFRDFLPFIMRTITAIARLLIWCLRLVCYEDKCEGDTTIARIDLKF